MANEFKVKNGLIVIGDLTTSGTITINGALAATQSWVTSQAYLTSASLSGYATQSYVTSALAALVDAAPAALDTLNELAAALGDDASFSTTITNSIANKVAKSGDTMTGSLLFANNADNVRLQKGSSFLNLRDPWNNIHLYNGGDGNYIDANVHYWRSQGSSYWMTLNGTGLGIGTTSPLFNLQVGSNAGTIATTTIRLQNSYLDTNGYYGFNIDAVDNGVSGHDLRFLGRSSPTGAFSELVRIKNTGNVGIGISSPAYKLDVNGETRLGKLITTWSNSPISPSAVMYSESGYNTVFAGNGQFSTSYLALMTTGNMSYMGGNVGIGTTNPKQMLVVEGVLATKPSSVDGYYSYLKSNWNENDAFELGISENGSSNFHKLITSSNYYFGSTLQFWTADTERIRINAAGSVGIGTTSPDNKLTVKGSNALVDVQSTADGQTIGFLARYLNSATLGGAFRYTTGDAQLYIDNFYPGNDGVYSDINIRNCDTGGTLTNRIKIKGSSGNVGIGTSSPNEKLHVAGNINAYVNGGIDAGLFASTSAGSTTIALRSNGITHFNGGNVGIGTTSPSDKLSVNGNIGVEYAGYFGFYRYSGAIHTFSTDGITSAMFGIAGGVFSGRSDAGLTVSGYDQLRFYTENSERIRINRAGKVSIGTTDTNSDKSDFTVYTGSGASLALVDDQVRMGSTDVNWGVALRSTGYLETYGQALYLQSLAGNHPVVVRPNNTSSVEFYQDYTLFNGLNLSISRVNSVHAANYFRGDSSHLVIGTGGTLYLNYGGNTTNITGNTTNSGWLGVTGIVSANARKLSLGILDLNSGITPAQYKIKTNIPWNYGGSDFTVNIKGFRYGVGQMVSLSIGWHYYNNEFYNRNAISNGAWAPTISLAKSPDGYVIIYIPGPDYWPKLYVESVYSSNSTDSYTTGWSWTDADLSDCTLIQTVPYKDLATSITGNSGTTSQTNFSSLTINSAAVATQAYVGSQGYLTSYTETDTLASVTNRGESTTGRINVRGPGNQGGGNIMMGNTGESINKWSYLTSTHYNASSQPQGFALIGGLATSGGNAVVIGGNIYETNPATEIQFWTHGTNTHNLGGTQRGVINSSGNWGIGTTSPGDYKLYVNGGQFGTLLRGGDLGTGSDVVRMIKSDGSCAMIVRGDGNIGIGTFSPTAKLFIEGNDIVLNTEGSVQGKSLYFRYSDGGNIQSDSYLKFSTGGSPTEKMRITDSGLVSIGTTSPFGKLTVAAGASYAVTASSVQRYVMQAINTSNSVNSTYGWWWFHDNNSNMGFHADGIGDILTLTRGGAAIMLGGHTMWHAGNDGSGSGLDADTVDGVQASSLLRSDIYNSNYGGLQVFRNIGTIDGSWEDSNHTFSLENGDAGNIVLNFHRAGYTSNNLRYNGGQFRFDAALESTGVITATGGNSTNWNTAYSWGNHASASYATTSYVTTQINNLIAGAPGALDTLDELAAALGDDASFATTVTNSIAGKVSKSGDTMTGDLIIGTASGVAFSQPFGDFAQLRFDNSHSDTNRGPNKIVMHDNGGSWIGGFGIHSDTVSYYTGGHHRWYKTDSPTSSTQVMQLDASGNLNIGGFLTESSSLKLKENIETSEGNLEKVVNLRPVTYNKIGSQTTELGLIAEEVAEVYPEFVQYDENGEPIGVNYSRLTAALIGAVKQLTKRIETLENNG
jgi:hypothetical protein